MKRIVIPLLILMIIPLVSAVKITEVELNPTGSDSGNEWIELYSKEEINLEGYRLINNDGDEIIFNESLRFSGYYSYILSKQWLDNSDEKIFLYEGDSLIDETEIFEDGKNNDKTWQLCGNSWEFKESSKGGENNCEEQENEDTETQTSSEDEKDNDEEEKEKESRKSSEREEEKKEEEDNKHIEIGETGNNENEMIILSSKDIKTNGDSSNQDKDKKALYGLAIFCVLLLCLFFVQRRKKDGIE